MLKFFNRINKFFRDLLLEDVDQPHNGPLPYHKGFRSKDSYKKHKEALNRKRNYEQQEQSRGI
ncbi:hypothetical protein [Winogradskyella tangerina]|uniref:hypothetical protein n=1 Tax=Winogradskyella tangerina TaxID=2023240 RepID=UPI000DBE4C89|nr:hypothetical protein [Winogradskyella tangerina]